MTPLLLAAAIWTNVSTVLVVIALLLAIGALVKPTLQGQLVAVAVLLLAIAVLVGRVGTA